METNIIIIIMCVVVCISVIVILVIRNQKDKKELMRKLIDQGNNVLPKEPDNEVDPSSVI